MNTGEELHSVVHPRCSIPFGMLWNVRDIHIELITNRYSHSPRAAARDQFESIRTSERTHLSLGYKQRERKGDKE